MPRSPHGVKRLIELLAPVADSNLASKTAYSDAVLVWNALDPFFLRTESETLAKYISATLVNINWTTNSDAWHQLMTVHLGTLASHWSERLSNMLATLLLT